MFSRSSEAHVNTSGHISAHQLRLFLMQAWLLLWNLMSPVASGILFALVAGIMVRWHLSSVSTPDARAPPAYLLCPAVRCRGSAALGGWGSCVAHHPAEVLCALQVYVVLLEVYPSALMFDDRGRIVPPALYLGMVVMAVSLILFNV